MSSRGISSSGNPAEESIHPLSLRTYQNKTYYSLPYAARAIGVSRMTMLRWVNRIGGSPKDGDGIEIECIRDAMSGRYFVPFETILALKERGKSLFSH